MGIRENFKKCDQFPRKNSHFPGVSNALDKTFQVPTPCKELEVSRGHCCKYLSFSEKDLHLQLAPHSPVRIVANPLPSPSRGWRGFGGPKRYAETELL